jgi:Ca2+/Na+ antiporter
MDKILDLLNTLSRIKEFDIIIITNIVIIIIAVYITISSSECMLPVAKTLMIGVPLSRF